MVSKITLLKRILNHGYIEEDCTCTPESCDEFGDPGCLYCQSLDCELPCPKEPDD